MRILLAAADGEREGGRGERKRDKKDRCEQSKTMLLSARQALTGCQGQRASNTARKEPSSTHSREQRALPALARQALSSRRARMLSSTAFQPRGPALRGGWERAPSSCNPAGFTGEEASGSLAAPRSCRTPGSPLQPGVSPGAAPRWHWRLDVLPRRPRELCPPCLQPPPQRAHPLQKVLYLLGVTMATRAAASCRHPCAGCL